MQVDLQYAKGPVVLHAYYGQAEDDFSWSNAGGPAGRQVGPVSSTFSTDDVETHFYDVLGQYKFSDKFYVATRYGVSTNESAGISSDEELSRIQIGAGYWFNGYALLKVEYVKQTEEANSGGQVTDGFEEADWDGVTLEASFRF